MRSTIFCWCVLKVANLKFQHKSVEGQSEQLYTIHSTQARPPRWGWGEFWKKWFTYAIPFKAVGVHPVVPVLEVRGGLRERVVGTNSR